MLTFGVIEWNDYGHHDLVFNHEPNC